MTVSRSAFILWAAQALERKVPYLWGGKESSTGLDCSGFITAPLWQLSHGSLDMRATHNTDRLFKELPHVGIGAEQSGDVACYRGANSTGPSDIEHVMLVLYPGVVVGQAYGGKLNVSKEYSVARGHWTKALRSDYRPDLCGFLRLPLLP